MFNQQDCILLMQEIISVVIFYWIISRYSRANGAKRRSWRKPGGGLLIPLGYLHPGKCEHSEVKSRPPCHGRSTVFVVLRMRESSLISKI